MGMCIWGNRTQGTNNTSCIDDDDDDDDALLSQEFQKSVPSKQN